MTTNTTTTARKSQRDYYNEIIALCREAGRDDLIEFVEGRIVQLDKKNSSSKKLTPNQIENESIKSDIMALVAENPNQIFTVTDFMKSVSSLDGLSNQRANAIVGQLVKENQLVKFYEKRRAYFRVPTAADFEDEGGEE